MINKAIDHIRKQGTFSADIGVILGSGLGAFVDALEKKTRIRFTDIPGFPVSTVEGHAGEIVHGYLNEVPVLANAGRVHFYEGYSLDQVIYPVEILHGLGVKTLIITNAAGSIRKNFHPGDLMLISDLMNLTGRSIYGIDPEPEAIFSDATLAKVQEVSRSAGIALKSGAYAGLNGPSYETPAEIRFLRLKGADAVGMSTVHESLAAHRLGMDVIGISCLTNYAAGILDQPLDHQEVIETGLRVQQDFSRLVKEIILDISNS